MSWESARHRWEDGARSLAAAPPADRRDLDRVVERIVEELRRRLGGPFTTDELAALYESAGIDWCLEIAAVAAPANPRAWDAGTVAGAAFLRYAREASDFAGGRRRNE